jgi:hypothetical protein
LLLQPWRISFVTKSELFDRLRDVEETLLVELLGLTSSDIVDRCLDLIEERYEYLYQQVKDDEFKEND